MRKIALEAGIDPTQFRKVIALCETEAGSPYRFSDPVVRALIIIAERLGTPVRLPRTRKR